MFVPAISTLLWVLVYSWPAEVVSNPLNVATTPADLQLLKGPQIANVTSYPDLLITQALNATRSQLFPIGGTNFWITLSSPPVEQTIAVETLQEILVGGITACQIEVARGRASIVPYTIFWIGPTPDNIKLKWFNLDDKRRGAFGEMIDIFVFLLFISTTEEIPRPNPRPNRWFAQAFSYMVYWVTGPGSPPELVGRGTVGL